MNSVDLPAETLFLPILFYAAAVVACVVTARSDHPMARLAPSWLTIAGAVTGAAIAVNALLDGGTETLAGWDITTFARVSFRLNPLAAFFLLVISLPAIAAAWYGVGYLDAAPAGKGAHHGPHRAAVDGLLAAFLGAMSLLVMADGVFGFLIAWELMSLVSFFLVIGDGHAASTRRAAFVYVVMTHIGTGLLLIAFLILSRHAGSFDFGPMRDAASALGHWERDIAFLLALIGFGTKAGLIPLHVWLPRAHPAAPSHVSALMSGVMVKTAIYGLIRLVWELAGPAPSWWGGTLIVAGAVSAVLGILYALMERDLKRVLAYSTIEHIGIITLGLGVAVMLSSSGHEDGAALALVATLVHLLSHALFKGLLFLGAGAVQTGTGTRDLERLGGLIRRMPRTTALFLIGSVAIAALPPLNGFAGEWLLFQSLLQFGATESTLTAAAFAGVGAGAPALTGALALACFVRAFGIGFLAQPRTDEARNAREVDRSMQGGMALLAVGCVVLGLFPSLIFRLLRPVTDGLVGVSAHPSLGGGWVFDADQVQGTYAPLLIVAGLGLLGVLPWAVARLAGGTVRTRVSPTWVCGGKIEPRMQYSATGFAKPIRLIFQAVIRPVRTVTLDRNASPYVVSGVHYEESVHPVYERYLYRHGVNLLLAASHRIRTVQSGSTRAYLTYLFVALVVLLLVAR